MSNPGVIHFRGKNYYIHPNLIISLSTPPIARPEDPILKGWIGYEKIPVDGRGTGKFRFSSRLLIFLPPTSYLLLPNTFLDLGECELSESENSLDLMPRRMTPGKLANLLNCDPYLSRIGGGFLHLRWDVQRVCIDPRGIRFHIRAREQENEKKRNPTAKASSLSFFPWTQKEIKSDFSPQSPSRNSHPDKQRRKTMER